MPSLTRSALLWLFGLPALCWCQAPIDVQSYTGRITLDLSARQLQGRVTVVARGVGGELSALPLDLRGCQVDSVWVDGQVTSWTHQDAVLRISLPSPRVEARADILYHGSPTPEDGSPAWGGFFWGEPTFTMGVGFNAPYVSMTRHWLPCHDTPADKATFDLTFVVPEDYSVAGTGLLVQHQRSSGTSSWRWVENHPTATYLVTLAVDRYARVLADWKGLPLEYYVAPEDSNRARTYFAPVASMLDAFTAAYGPYPFDKMGYCLTPIGSMEHQTMVSLAEAVFRGENQAGATVAHELAHQWWGDWVSVADFADAWLSEGFATFSEAIWQEAQGGRSRYISTARQFGSMYRSYVASSEGIFPLYDFPRTPPSSNYPQTIYQKGAAVLVMLRQVMGDSAFFAGMREYGRRFGYGNARTSDFRQVMESAGGQALDWFFDEWVIKAGWPKYILERYFDAPSSPLRFTLYQTQNDPLFRMPLPVMIVRDNKDTIRTTILNDAVPQQMFTFPEIPTGSVRSLHVDFDGLILKTLTTRTVSGLDTPGSPTSFLLHPVYPNPALRQVQIPVTLSRTLPVRLEIRDLLGRLHAVLTDSTYSPGEHVFSFDTASLPLGTYLVRLVSLDGIHQVLLRH